MQHEKRLVEDLTNLTKTFLPLLTSRAVGFLATSTTHIHYFYKLHEDRGLWIIPNTNKESNYGYLLNEYLLNECKCVNS